jgi:putative SOS response-associated peptidase YedK
MAKLCARVPTCDRGVRNFHYTTIDTIVGQDGERRLVPMRWGLVPSWWSKPRKELNLATFNARAETVAEKPFFRGAFKRNRCLILVSGYYEWQDTADGKQPWYFTARDGSPALTIAGLWDEWPDKETGTLLNSCTMIITEPNKFVARCMIGCRFCFPRAISSRGLPERLALSCSNPRQTICCSAGRCRSA